MPLAPQREGMGSATEQSWAERKFLTEPSEQNKWFEIRNDLEMAVLPKLYVPAAEGTALSICHMGDLLLVWATNMSSTDLP